MLSFITLAIAYFIEPSASSFLVSLLIGSFLGNVIRGNVGNSVQEGVIIFMIALAAYENFQPESFIAFWGLGMVVYIIAFVLSFIIDILYGVLVSLFTRGK